MSRVQPPERRTEGTQQQVTRPVAPLLDGDGNRQREVIFGATFRVLEQKDGRARGFAGADGYVGWIDQGALGEPREPTHVVSAIRSYAKPTPMLKVTEPVVHLSRGSLLTVTSTSDGWAGFRHPSGTLWLPEQHIDLIENRPADPASVAELYLGTPYLWGGNSAFGIDCSGLVSAALLACGTPCPGDSDMQEAAFAHTDRGDLRRGDLVFWTGHVGMMLSDESLIHANAHHMAVAIERLDEAIARIGRTEAGQVTSCRRP